MSKPICIINGPNLNLLGRREPEVYGRDTLADIEARCRRRAGQSGYEIRFLQSNHEGEIVDFIQDMLDRAAGIVINAAAYTHTSVAIHDALRMFAGPKVEIHISNPHLRESFRHVSYVSPAVDAVIAGLGTFGYELAVDAVVELARRRDTGNGT